MKNEEYVKNALVTESVDYDVVGSRLSKLRIKRILHASLGLSTESAEIADQLKKHLFYGKPLDVVNLAEEAGDVLWYLALLCDELGVSVEKIMEMNVLKLKARFGDKFTEDKAVNRDVNKELSVFEGL